MRAHEQAAMLSAVVTAVLSIVALAGYKYPSLSDVNETCKLGKVFEYPCAVARAQLASFSFIVITTVIAAVCALVQLVALIKARYVRGRYTLWIIIAVLFVMCALLACFVVPITLWSHNESYPKNSTQTEWFVLEVIAAVFSVVVLALVIFQKRSHGHVYQLL